MRGQDLSTADARLRWAREQAGFDSAAAFVRAHDLQESTYRSHENGQRAFKRPIAEHYAELLGGDITWHWLLFGDEVRRAADADELPPPRPQRGRQEGESTYAIEELDVRAGAGNARAHDVMEAERVVAEWRMPRDLLRAQTSAPPGGIKIITVYGDSMVPDFLPGERLMVDTEDRTPSPPGVFVVWDGVGLVVKRLELIPYSDPPRVRLISRNKEYSDFELAAEEVRINGRVIGKWLWT